MGRARLVFFSMPFGTKQVGTEPHNFDETWKKLLKRSVPDGWEDMRIDEVNQPGTITEQLQHVLRTADVVVFDVTTANPNVLYELGIRDVFAPGRRVLIARDGTVPPFNIATERVLHYPRDVATAIATGFPQLLRQQILHVVGGVTGGRRQAPEGSRLRAQIERATNVPSLVGLWHEWKTFESVPADPLLQLAKMFSQHRRLDLAIEVAHRAYQEAPNEWEVARTLGWYLRKSGAYDEACGLLRQAIALNPSDIESMGMLGGIYKRRALDMHRRGDDCGRREWFEQSRKLYADASAIDPLDIYSLVNAGALTFIAGQKDNAPYRQIIEIVGKDPRGASTWDLLALAEAYLVEGKGESALTTCTAVAERSDFTVELRDSECDQLLLLQEFGLVGRDVAAARSILLGERVRPGNGIVLIHLSDVHFGKKPGTPDATEMQMHRFRDRLGLHDHRSLAAHILDECAAEVRSSAAVFVVISGDSGYQATAEEYDQAKKFVSTLLDGLKVGTDRLVIVPGNHDVNWKLSGYQLSHRFDAYLGFIAELYGERFKTVYPFVDWDFRINSPRPLSHQILSVHKNPEHEIVFVGFNSCVVEDHQRHFGAIGQEQIKLAEKQLADISPSWVRVAVLHHHVLPLESRLSEGKEGTEMDGTLVRDYSLVERAFHSMGFDLVLHGHKHEPGIRVSRLVPDGEKSLIVCGAGSAGVEKDELPPDCGNHFAIYRIPASQRRAGTTFVEIEWRTLPVNDINRRWTKRGPWKVEG